MIAGLLGFALFAVLVPLLVSEAGDLAPSLARWLLRWGARHIGQVDQASRYEEEWLADLERVPGKVTKLAHACGVVALSVPRLRAHFRRRPRRALLSGWIADRAAQHLARVQESDAALQRVAETLVPHFADHCFIDLFQGDALIRRVQRNAAGWTPPPGTWAQAGDQIRYPEGHFCQQAIARLDTIIIADLAQESSIPAPSAQSRATAEQVGLKSVLAAPLHARGMLLGVISLAISDLTGRSEHFDTGDRDIISAVASRLSAAIDTPVRPGTQHGARRRRAGPQPEFEQRQTGLGIFQA
jgi:GAF domain